MTIICYVYSSGDTLLTCAARLGHLELLQYLMERTDLDVNIPDKNGFSIVDHAIVNSHLEMLKVLLEL